jgi:hypothetical protein
VAEEDFHCSNREWLIDDKVNKDDKTIAHPMYLTHLMRRLPLTSLFPMGPSIHRHQLLWMKTSPLLPLMTKLN